MHLHSNNSHSRVHIQGIRLFELFARSMEPGLEPGIGTHDMHVIIVLSGFTGSVSD